MIKDTIFAAKVIYLNPFLYKKVEEEGLKKFKKRSYVMNLWVLKEYKSRGGKVKYSGKVPDNKQVKKTADKEHENKVKREEGKASFCLNADKDLFTYQINAQLDPFTFDSNFSVKEITDLKEEGKKFITACTDSVSLANYIEGDKGILNSINHIYASLEKISAATDVVYKPMEYNKQISPQTSPNTEKPEIKKEVKADDQPGIVKPVEASDDDAIEDYIEWVEPIQNEIADLKQWLLNLSYAISNNKDDITYNGQRISNLNQNFWDYQMQHAQGHLPAINSPSQMEEALKALGVAKDFNVIKKTIYASDGCIESFNFNFIPKK